MKNRQLASFSVSALGLGCMNLSHAYGAPVSAQQAERVLGPRHRQQQDERDRQEGHVALEEAHHGARPARRHQPLHRRECHTGRRDRGEEDPVAVLVVCPAAVAVTV